MRRQISPNNPVRRRLFIDEDDDISSQARTDNFSNSIQEDIKRETQEKTLKWNFDFSNETPLEGNYEWFKRDGETWIAVKPDTDEAQVMKNANETTPRRQSDDAARITRKRKREEKRIETENVAVRRITF